MVRAAAAARRWPAFDAVLASALLAGAGAAQAVKVPEWEAGAGFTVMSLPDYRGSDQSRTYAFPIPYFVYRGPKIQIDRRGASGVLWRGTRAEFDISAAITNPSNSSRNTARSGMPDLLPALEIGPRLNYTLHEARDGDFVIRIEAPLRYAVGFNTKRVDGIGLTFTPMLQFDWRRLGSDRSWNFAVMAGPVFGDRAYHRYYYDVAPQYASASRQTYASRGGFGGTQATMAASRRMGRWWVGGFLRAYDLHGATYEDSPLVRRHYAVQAGVIMTWIFAQSSQMVDRDEP